MKQQTPAMILTYLFNESTHQRDATCTCQRLTRMCIGLTLLVAMSLTTLSVTGQKLYAQTKKSVIVSELGVSSTTRDTSIEEGESISIRIHFGGQSHQTSSMLKYKVDDPNGFLVSGQSGERTVPLASRSQGYTFTLQTKRNPESTGGGTIKITAIENEFFNFQEFFGVFTINVTKFPEISVSSFEIPRRQNFSVTEGHPIRILLDSASAKSVNVFLLVSESTAGGDHIASMHEGRRLVNLTSQSKSFDIATKVDSNSTASSTVTITVLPTSLYDINHSRSAITVTVKNTEVPEITIYAMENPAKAGNTSTIVLYSSKFVPVNLSVKLSVEETGGNHLNEEEITVTIPANRIRAFQDISLNSGSTGSVTIAIVTDTTGSYALGSSNNSVTITIDNTTRPAVSVLVAEPSSRTITEGETFKLEISLTQAVTVDVKLQFNETPIGAAMFNDQIGGIPFNVGGNHIDDYVETISFSGESTKEITIMTRVDYSSNLDSAIEYAILGGVGYKLITGSSTQSYGRIIVRNKADKPLLTITSSGDISYGEQAIFNLTASHLPSQNPLMVNYSYTINGNEMTPSSPAMVMFSSAAPYTGNIEFMVPLSDARNDFLVTTTLKTGEHYIPKFRDTSASLIARSLTVTNRIPSISIEPSTNKTITEGESAVFVVNTSSAPASGTSLQISVNVSGAESFLSDRQGGNQLVEINRNNYMNGVMLSVATIDDNLGEFDDSITATLTSGTGYNIDTTRQIAVIDVLDDDLPVISIMSTAESVDEGETVSFMLTASKFVTANLNVKVKVEGLAGILGDNAGEKTATFRSDDNDLNFSFSFDTETDGVYEGDSTITVTILDEDRANATYIKHSSNNVATATIKEIDPPSVTISAKTSPIARDTNPEFVLTLAAPVDDPIIIDVMISSETSNIFTADQSGTRNIPVAAGLTELSFEVSLVANLPSGQNDQIIKIQAELQTGTGYTLRDDVQPAIVAVIDPNDTANFVEISISTTSNGPATEGGIITLTLSSKKDGMATNPEFPVIILVQISGADSFLNENQPTDLRVAITPESAKPEATIEIKTVNDSRYEPGAVLTATVIQSLGYNISPTEGSVSVVIINNPEDIPQFTISPPNDITEGQMAIFEIRSEVSVSTPLPINFRIEFDGNVQTWRRPSEIIFPANANNYTLSIPTFNDGNPQSTSGSIRLVLLEGNIYQLSDVQTEYDATIEVQNNAITNNEPRIAVAQVVVNNIIRHLSMNQEAASSTPVTPVISISALEPVINEGNTAQFMIMTSAQTSRQLSIQINILPVGEFEAVSLNNSVSLPIGLQTTMLELPTIKNPRATNDGNITVQIAPGTGYMVAKHPNDSATISVSDAEDRNALHQQINLANREVLPVQLRSIGLNSMNVITNRFKLLGSNLNTSTIQLNGRNSIPNMLTNTGDSLNQESFNLTNLLHDSNFNYELVSSDESFGSMSVWGLSNQGELGPTSTSKLSDWEGETLYGQLGFDTRLQNGVVTGLASTFKQTQFEFESSSDNALNYQTSMTGSFTLSWLEFARPI